MKTNQLKQFATGHPVAPSPMRSLGWLLFVGLLLPLTPVRAEDIIWGQTNTTSSFNWTDGANWVGGVVPTDLQGAVYVSTNSINPTIVVNQSTNIQDFTITRAPVVGLGGVADSTGVTLNIAAGQKLSVLGPNGFVVRHSLGTTNGFKAKCVYNFTGDTLAVSNSAARFVLNSGVSYSQSGTWDTYNMSGLTNLTVDVAYFGIANAMLAGSVTDGDQGVQITSPKTNIVRAWAAADYTQLDFTNSVEISRMGNSANNSYAQNAMYQLGYSNAFYCDSFGIGRGNSAGNTINMSMGSITGTPNGKNSVGFNVSFANVNSATPTSSAFFRNTNGIDPMTLLAIGVDSGMSVTNARNNGILNLRGGRTDMWVDQIWLGRNRTNAGPTGGTFYSDMGGFAFDNGTVVANTIIAGYMAFTNIAFCGGYIDVGTNGTMTVNNYLELGHTPDDPLGDFAAYTAQTRGQVQIENGGRLNVKQITVGALSTNNTITCNNGGLLVVSNTIANSTNGLNTLTLNGGTNLTLFVTAGTTNAYVTNLITTANTVRINIAGYTGTVPSTNVIINYQNTAAPVRDIQVGSYPITGSYNNMQVKDLGDGNVVLIVKNDAPRNLAWRGKENSNWDYVSTNWWDINVSQFRAFTDNDNVTFSDLATNYNITIADSVSPGSFTVTNNANSYTFNNSGSFGVSGAALSKWGTNTVQFDSTLSTVGVQVNQGSLTGSGSVSSISVASGASMNFGGTVSGTLSISGNATLASSGIANGTVSVATGGTFSNDGTVNGALSMSAGSAVNNNGTGLMTAIGNTTIQTNAVLNNAGTIYNGAGQTLTVALGGMLVDTTSRVADLTAGSINVGSLNVFGSYIPGGNTIVTNKVTDITPGATFLGNPNGRINLNQGSTTVIRVDKLNSQVNTMILSQNQGFGGSFAFKNFNGGTLVISNVGPAFAAGDAFKIFGYYYNAGDILNAGLNTTNTYPVITPATPGPGLVWELDQLIPQGIIRVMSATDPFLTYTMTNNMYTFSDNGTNKIVTELTWPEDKIGGWVQILNTTLTNGLSATNWSNLNQNQLTNMPASNVYIVTNTITGPGATFYRYVYP